MARGKSIKGGGIMETLSEYEPTLYILYGIGVVILIGLIYIVFFKTSVTPTPSPSETIMPVEGTLDTSTTSPTTKPTNSVVSKITNVKQKISNSLNDDKVISIIKGKLEDWGDDIDKLPADVKEKAMACYKNADGCVF
jgi:hypothetical protein